MSVYLDELNVRLAETYEKVRSAGVVLDNVADRNLQDAQNEYADATRPLKEVIMEVIDQGYTLTLV